MSPLKFENILGYRVANQGIEPSVNQVVSWLESGEHKTFVCANPHSLVLAAKDSLFDEAIHSADLVTPDGVGIILASKILGGIIRERVTGSDIFTGLSRALNRRTGYSYFFLGSTEETLDKIHQKLVVDYPNIQFVGSHSPPYKSAFNKEDNRLMIEAINAAKPDVLWVGMTAPKQETWIHQNRDKLDVKFIGAIGAVLDFYVGNVKRSHPIFLKFGLEWLPRLLQEPRRLWKRNFISSPKFMYRVICHKINGEKNLILSKPKTKALFAGANSRQQKRS